jgi:hypothetical protein
MSAGEYVAQLKREYNEAKAGLVGNAAALTS